MCLINKASRLTSVLRWPRAPASLLIVTLHTQLPPVTQPIPTSTSPLRLTFRADWRLPGLSSKPPLRTLSTMFPEISDSAVRSPVPPHVHGAYPWISLPGLPHVQEVSLGPSSSEGTWSHVLDWLPLKADPKTRAWEGFPGSTSEGAEIEKGESNWGSFFQGTLQGTHAEHTSGQKLGVYSSLV